MLTLGESIVFACMALCLAVNGLLVWRTRDTSMSRRGTISTLVLANQRLVDTIIAAHDDNLTWNRMMAQEETERVVAENGSAGPVVTKPYVHAPRPGVTSQGVAERQVPMSD